MLPKPNHLGPAYAAQFTDPSVVAAYHLRPPCPAEVFAILDCLILGAPRVVLDLGTGTGEIARQFVTRVDQIDAVDPSVGMLARAEQLPGGEDPRIAWLCHRAEDAPLGGPYALVTAGASLHWMEWDVVLPRRRSVLSPSGMLAIIDTANSRYRGRSRCDSSSSGSQPTVSTNPTTSLRSSSSASSFSGRDNRRRQPSRSRNRCPTTSSPSMRATVSRGIGWTPQQRVPLTESWSGWCVPTCPTGW